jgi:hypothetical protein
MLDDVLRRDDITLYWYVLLQGISRAWTPVGETRSFTGHAIAPIINSRTLAPSYGEIGIFQGIAQTGRLNLSLEEWGNYLGTQLLGDGTETILTADVEPADGIIHVESTASFASAGLINIHREQISYISKTPTTFAGCTRLIGEKAGIAAMPHRIAPHCGPIKDGTEIRVRVGTTPKDLDGRWISVNVIALDPGGQPIYDNDGAFTFEVWRGIVTACPPSADGVSYSLQAETLERWITSRPPLRDWQGRLATRAWAADMGAGQFSGFGVSQMPLFIPDRRSLACIRLQTSDGSFDETIGLNATDAGVGRWLTLGQIAESINTALASSGCAATVMFSLAQDAAAEGNADPQTRLQLVIYGPAGLFADAGELTITLIHGERDVWLQLGFVGQHETTIAYSGGSPIGPGYCDADSIVAQVYLAPDDDQIPILSSSGGLPSTHGWLKMGEEVIYFGGITEEGTVDGIPCYTLEECKRGYAGSPVAIIVVRAQGMMDSGDPPTLDPVLCVGGNATIGADEADANIWISLRKILGGSDGETDTGPWHDWPGLGIDNEHLDTDAIDALAAQTAACPAIRGVVTDVRQWLNDALAIEGYALVTRPTASGCVLSPVRVGAPDAGETILTGTLDSPAGVKVTGGLNQIINRITIKAPEGGEAHYHDADSITQYGVHQGETLTAQIADQTILCFLAHAVRRLFALTAGRRTCTLQAALTPAGRWLAPGDAVALTLPNAALSGTWRVLSASTPLRGRGSIEFTALRVLAWDQMLYAPTTEVQSVVGLDVTVTTGDGQWFVPGATLRVYDPTDYTDAVNPVISSVDGDVLTVDDVTGVSPLDLLEYEDFSTCATEDRYLWQLLDTYEWGD